MSGFVSHCSDVFFFFFRFRILGWWNWFSFTLGHLGHLKGDPHGDRPNGVFSGSLVGGTFRLVLGRVYL